MSDERHLRVSIGAPETQAQRATRAVLGEATPDKVALVDVLQAHEKELTAWLQDPANRERLMSDPLAALSEVLPEESLKTIGTPPKIRAELQKQLGSLQLEEFVPSRTPAMDLFDKVWAFVAASPANLAAFNADSNGTVRNADPAAPQEVVDEVITAIDTARGIAHLSPVSPTYFSLRVLSSISPGSLIERP
jgi:hypothetical protein